MPDDKLSALYQSLRSKNKDFTVSLDQFRTDMSDPEKRARLHGSLANTTPGFTVGFDQFSSDMGFGQPETSPTDVEKQKFPWEQQQVPGQQPMSQTHPQTSPYQTIGAEPLGRVADNFVEKPKDQPPSMEKGRIYSGVTKPNMFTVSDDGSLTSPEEQTIAPLQTTPTRVASMPEVVMQRAKDMAGELPIEDVKKLAGEKRDEPGARNLEESTALYEVAFEKNPNDPGAPLQIGYNYAITGDFPRALENIDASLQIYDQSDKRPGVTDKGNPYAYQLRSFVNLNMGNYDQAMKDASRAMQLQGYKREEKDITLKDENDYYSVAASAQYGQYAAENAGNQQAAEKYNKISRDAVSMGNDIIGAKSYKQYNQYLKSDKFQDDLMKLVPIARNIKSAVDQGLGGLQDILRDSGDVSDKKTDDKTQQVVRGVSKLIGSVISGTMATGTPAEGLFYAAEKILPEKYMAGVMQPITSAAQAMGYKTDDEWYKMADLAGAIVIMAVAHKGIVGGMGKVADYADVRRGADIAKNVIERKPLTEADVTELKKIVDNATPETVKSGAELVEKMRAEKSSETSTEKTDVLPVEKTGEVTDKPVTETLETSPETKPVDQVEATPIFSEKVEPVAEVKTEGTSEGVIAEKPAEKTDVVVAEEPVVTGEVSDVSKKSSPESINADIERSKTEPVVGLFDRVNEIKDADMRSDMIKRLSDANAERNRTQVDQIKQIESKPDKTPEEQDVVSNSVIPIDKDFVKKTKSMFYRFFRTRGNMPKEGIDTVRESQNVMRAEKFGFEKDVSALQKWAKKELGTGGVLTKNIPKDKMDMMNSALSGDASAMSQLSAIAPETAMRIVDVRNAMTKLQKTIEPLMGKNMAEIILNSEGTYLTRAYRLFLQPKSWKKVMDSKGGDAIRQNAETYIRNQFSNKGLNIPDVEVQGIINNILDAPNQKISRGKGGDVTSLDLSSFIHRKEIAPEIRALMGEIDNPFANAYITLTKLSGIAKSMEFMRDFADAGRGKWLFDKPTGEHVVPLFDKDSIQGRIMGKDVFTTREIKQAYEDLGGVIHNQGWARVFAMVNMPFKVSMTLLSTPGIARNLLSSMMINAANGRLNPVAAKRAVQLAIADMKSETRFKDTVKMLYERGILGESTRAGDVKSYTKDLFKDESQFDRVYDGIIKRTAKGAWGGIRKAWSVGDDVNRILGFYSELADLKRVYGNNKTLPELEKMAADKLIYTTPTYSRTPKIVDVVKSVPLVGPFPSWTAEIIRTSVNTIALGIKELKTPGERALGVKRLTAFAMMNAAPYAIRELVQYTNGTNDEDVERYRSLLPSYSKNDQIIPLDPSGSTLDYVNTSFIDPYSMWKNIFDATVKSGDMKQGVIDGVREFASPFISPEMGARVAGDLLYNKDQNDRKIYQENDDFGSMANDILSYVWKNVEPGTIKAAQKITQEGKKPMREIANTFFGVRTQSIDVPKSITASAKKYADAVSDAKQVYNKVRYNPTATQEDRVAALDHANRIYQKVFDDFTKKVGSAGYYIGDVSEVALLLKDAGLSKKEINALIINDFKGFLDEPIYDENGNKLPKKSGSGYSGSKNSGLGGGLESGLGGGIGGGL